MKQPAQNEGLLSVSGTGAPANTANTYQTGCIYKRTDGGAETAIYVNEGTFASPSWVPLLTTSFEVADLPDIGTLAYTTGAILQADGDSYEEVTDVALPKTGSLKIGDFVASAATTGGVALTNARDVYGDGQIDILQVHGVTTTNVGSDHSAKCGRFRHLVNISGTVETETYGVMGQLVVKSATLGHLHSGVIGTFEGHTSGVTINGGYTVGASCVMARLGGHATITATDPIAGFLAFNNGAAALASGNSCAFATSMASASYPWTLGVYMPVGSVGIGVRIGNWVTAGGTGGAIPFSVAAQNFNSDGQLGVVSCFGESTADLTSAYNAHVGRFRHLVSGSSTTIAHETYGLAGQLVVKSVTLTHLHAGLLGTFEANTTAVVSNGAYAYSAGAIIARVGGGALITATKDVCGVIAFLNGAAMASGACSAFAVGDQGTAAWTNAIAVERATNLFDLPAAGTDPVITNALVPATAPDGTTVGADACLRVLVNTTAYYIPLYDTLHA